MQCILGLGALGLSSFVRILKLIPLQVFFSLSLLTRSVKDLAVPQDTKKKNNNKTLYLKNIWFDILCSSLSENAVTYACVLLLFCLVYYWISHIMTLFSEQNVLSV